MLRCCAILDAAISLSRRNHVLMVRTEVSWRATVAPPFAPLVCQPMWRYSWGSHRHTEHSVCGQWGGGTLHSPCGASISAIGTLLFRMCADGQWGGGTNFPSCVAVPPPRLELAKRIP